MLVGVLTTSYPRTPGDPAGHFVASHVRALRAAGHDVEVIAAGGPSAHDDPGIHRIGGGNLFYTGGAPDRLEAAPRALLAAAAFAARMTATVSRRARRWDAIVAHWLAPSALAALPTRAPLLAIAHGGDVHTLRRLHLLAPALHALHRRGADLAFVTAELRDLAIAAAPGLTAYLARALVQPMGLDLAHFAALPRAPAPVPTALVVARLVPVKGVDIAIAAAERMTPPFHLVIAGDGPERTTLAARAAHARAAVSLVGAIDTRRRDDLLGQAWVVVVPSRVLPSGRTEGAPLIALEALAAGIPVVASAVGGLRDLAPAAVLVAPDDPDALAAALAGVLASPRPAAEYRAAVRHLDWSEVAPRLVPRALRPRPDT